MPTGKEIKFEPCQAIIEGIADILDPRTAGAVTRGRKKQQQFIAICNNALYDDSHDCPEEGCPESCIWSIKNFQFNPDAPHRLNGKNRNTNYKFRPVLMKKDLYYDAKQKYTNDRMDEGTIVFNQSREYFIFEDVLKVVREVAVGAVRDSRLDGLEHNLGAVAKGTAVAISTAVDAKKESSEAKKESSEAKEKSEKAIETSEKALAIAEDTKDKLDEQGEQLAWVLNLVQPKNGTQPTDASVPPVTPMTERKRPRPFDTTEMVPSTPPRKRITIGRAIATPIKTSIKPPSNDKEDRKASKPVLRALPFNEFGLIMDSLEQKIRDRIYYVDEGLRRRPPFRGTVRRCTQIDIKGEGGYIGASEVYREWCYLSTSTLDFKDMRLEFRSMNCYWTIESKTGRSVVDLAPDTFKMEHEVLFPREARFLIKSMHQEQIEVDGELMTRVFITMEELVNDLECIEEED